MWHTSRGDRTLAAAEADLLAEAIDMLMDDLLLRLDEQQQSSECEAFTGIELFDALTSEQQVGQLHRVATHLLTETVDVLPLTAINEATVAAIFAEIKIQLAIEIDMDCERERRQYDLSVHWRSLIAAAAMQDLERDDLFTRSQTDASDTEDQVAFRVPELDCNDAAIWETWIESLMDAILWDRDFEMASMFMDSDPVPAEVRRNLLGIDSEYFVEIAPEPKPSEVMSLVTETRSLLRKYPR